MMLMRFLPWTASVAAHGAAVLMLAWAFTGERAESVLFIDLSEVSASAKEGSGQAPAAGAEGRASTATPPTKSRAGRRSAEISRPEPQKTDIPAPKSSSSTPTEEKPPVITPPSSMPASDPPIAPATPPAPIASTPPSPPAATASPADGTSAGVSSSISSSVVGDSRSAIASPGSSPSGGGGASTGTPGAETGVGVSGQGTNVARLSVGAGDGPDVKAYHELLRRHISETLEYPAIVRRRGLSGTVEVEIAVRADGAIRDVTLIRSSSSSTLDEAAITAVKQLPRVKFPSGLPPRALRVRVPVVFEIR